MRSGKLALDRQDDFVVEVVSDGVVESGSRLLFIEVFIADVDAVVNLSKL